MANKLYPPQIEGALPAFYLDYDSSNTVVTGASIKIPFTQSSAVSNEEIGCFVLRFRTASTGSYLFSPIFTTNFNLGTKIVTFHLNSQQARQLNEGQYYKAQIAYCHSVNIDSYDNVIGSDIGYFSTVGIIKCTSRPKVSINNLTQSSVNYFQNEFIGLYDQSECKDQTEKVYSYEFIVYDENDDVYYTTGELLHQSAYDTNYDFSIDRVLINDFIKHGVTYSIQYKVKTENELELETPKYRLTNEYLASPNQDIEIKPESDMDNGYVTVYLKGAIDKEKSQHYILNEEVLESEKDDNGEYIADSTGKSIFYTIKSALADQKYKIEFLKTHTIFKNYDKKYINAPYFSYVITTNTPPNRVFFKNEAVDEIWYIYEEEYKDIIRNEELSEEEKQEAISQLSHYVPFATGREITKNLSYNYVEENLIDLKDYDLIQNIEQEARYYGTYVLSRANNSDNYQTWEVIAQFRLEAQTPSTYSFRDMTVEHGRKYKYGLQQTNIWGLISSRIESEPYEVSFEDMFLYDGDKLLKIRFNPKVDTFKTTILEQKSDTIGGRFPYITRNGNTYYKEFPIGGLIASEMDPDQMFHSRIQGVAHRHSTSARVEDQYDKDGNLIALSDMPENGMRDWRAFSDENILLEREFKLAVLDWLNNGKPKLFKSPYEGNYIVRLMKNTLQPVEELGRMLHTFTSEAYEIAECTYNNLVAYGFVNVNPPSDYVGQWRTYLLNDPEFKNANGDIVINFDAGLESFTIQDLMPGDMISLQFEGSNADEWEDIMIGITGSYLNCYYQGARITAFDSIIAQQLRTIPSQQYIGVNPWLEDIKRKAWNTSGNADVNAFSLTDYEYKFLWEYNFRDMLGDTLKKNISGNKIIYTIDDTFKKYITGFDPGEILDRINATIYKEKVYKIQLLNIEQARFRLRDIIPVYLVEEDGTPRTWTGGNVEHEITVSTNSNTDIEYVSTSPYGYPHRIEELTHYEMIDPYCIFEVFHMNADTHSWESINGKKQTPYYDAYYHTWLREYDPTFKINYSWKKVGWTVAPETDENSLKARNAKARYNKAWSLPYDENDIYDYEIEIETDLNGNIKHFYRNNIGHKTYLDDYFNLYYKEANQYFCYGNNSGNIFPAVDMIYYIKEYDTDISLATIKEKEYTELKNINSIHIGTGVIAELTFQIKVIDYYTEVRDQDVYDAKQYYLSRKNFYTNLMKNYADIQRSNYYMIKNQALRNAYNLLLNGTNGRNYLKEADRRIIRILLQNTYEVEQLKLLKLYNVSSINETLDLSAIEVLKQYKKEHSEDEDELYGTSHLLLCYYESNNGTQYYAIDTNAEGFQPIVQGSNMGDNLIDKTIYRQVNSSGKEIFYALDKARVKALYEAENSSSLIVYNNLDIIYGENYNIDTINDLVLNRTDLNDENIYVYELTKIENSAINTEYQLLNDIEAEDLKLTDRYIYMEEVPYSSYPVITFFEQKQLETISQYEENTDIEGVANKVRDLSGEVDRFNEEISMLLDLYESETNTYLELYNNLKELLDGYNNDVYKSWAYQELVKLLEAGESIADIRTQFVSNEEDIDTSLGEIQTNLKRYIGACQNLYYIIKDTLPQIALYQQMIDDGQEDYSLDNYLKAKILGKRGMIVLAITAMYNALEKIKRIVPDNSDYITTIYTKDIVDCFDKYNELYGELVDLSTHQLLSKYGDCVPNYYVSKVANMLDEKEKLEILIEAEETYTNPESYATMINYYEDLEFLWTWIHKYGNTPNSISIRNGEETYVAHDVLPFNDYYTIFMFDPTNATNRNTYYNPSWTQYFTAYQYNIYNEAKQINTFHYRTTLRTAIGSANQSLYNTFIFYPLAQSRKDLNLPDNSNSNYAYFNTRSETEQAQILEISSKLNKYVMDFIDNTYNRNIANNVIGYINSTYLNSGLQYNVETLTQRRENIINPPRDEITGEIIQENAINFYNNKILNAEATIKINPAVSLHFYPNTRPFFAIPINDKAQSLIYDNITTLSDVYTDPATGKQTILKGYYKTYLDYLIGYRLEYLQELLEQANKLLKLYQQQYANYFSKYNKYSTEYLEQEAIFNSYAGTEEMDYYLNPNGKTMEDFRQEVKEAWWTFLDLLDYKYTLERERGMYA